MEYEIDYDGRDPAGASTMPFWNMQLDADGSSTIVQQALAGFALGSVSGDAAPIWMREFKGEVKAIWVNIMPVGWVGKAHPTPALQWVVPLSGRWFIEAQDGTRIEMGQGDIHWGADLAGAGAHGSTAHRSGQLGDVPCVQIMVQFQSVDDPGLA